VYVNTALSDPSDPMVRKWGLHAMEGTEGSRLISELEIDQRDVVVKKKGYSGFHGTDLDGQLVKFGITDVVLVGIHTHVCVLLTAVGAFEHGYGVTTLEDCMTTGYRPNHDTRLRFFSTHTGDLISMRDWFDRVKVHGS
jgi:nicotinamidase-related amidase